MLLVSVFLLLIPYAFSLNFTFTSFQKSDCYVNMLCDGAANIPDTSLNLVRNQRDPSSQDINIVGRATYNEVIQLWDEDSKKLANFNTSFTFVIDSLGNTSYYGDGMAFFLAPYGLRLPDPPKVGGGTMGLILGGEETEFNSTEYPFVAVEFDIYPNWSPDDPTKSWDPPYIHVGVDINSIRSATNVSWDADVPGGRINEALISYNARTYNLSISFTNGFDSSNNIVWQHLHHIVDLRNYLPPLVGVGFSAATGGNYAIHKVNTWSFNSDEFPNVGPTPSMRPRLNITALGLGLLGAAGFVIFCGAVWFFLWKDKKKMEEDDDDDEFDEHSSDDFEGGAGPKKYSYDELAIATNFFEDGQKLGQGGFGGVFRGFFKDSNSYVAIKRISKDSKQGKKEFASEVRIISQLRHRNLVQLIGWCHERKEFLLVYEYMPNGSLDSHLFKEQSLLTWTIRFKIAHGLASALLYLHEEWEQCVVHRDIKSSNIMLDSNFNVKLGDFGLARLVDHAKGAQTTALAGTMGYMAPECITTGRASKESDVYSFGIVALEIACGRKPINPKAPEDEINIVKWVWDNYGSGKILEVVDSRLKGEFDHNQAECLIIVGLWCAHPDQNCRSSIRQAIHVLNFETPFPNLPSRYPILSYNEFPSSFSILQGSNVPGESQNQNVISINSNTNSSGFTTTSDDKVSPSKSLL